MFKNILNKVAGNTYQRELEPYLELVEEVAALEPQTETLTDAEMAGLTEQFRARLADGETLDDILVEVFAAVREASRRAIGLRPYDVQIIGGAVLHEGKVAEMKTGEGKTLVATLPLYLNALTGKGAHLVTVNDYLARRDGGWMGKVYQQLGASVAVIGKEQYSAIYDQNYVDPGGTLEDERLVHWRPITRQEAYQADITYGTSSEFGFDYLRDNTAISLDRIVQRGHSYVIVDETDSVLIDGARTPLIISGPDAQPASEYTKFAKIVRGMKRNTADLEIEEANGDYDIDERTKSIILTDLGIARVEKQVPQVDLEAGESIYDPKFFHLVHYLDNALKAEYTFNRDVDYIVQNGRVILIDQTTGRPMPSRRYSEGLHQAIEAKEGVTVRREDITIATITLQNYFRMYDKLAGMTGTALTEAEEFDEVYNLEVIGIPTNVEHMALKGELIAYSTKVEIVHAITYERPENPDVPAFFKRIDFADVIYKNEEAKFNAVIKEIESMRAQGRPTLVGTASVEASEVLSKMLKAKKVEHQVLNAKHHDKEALVVAQAGLPGAVVISTNMAGRGTDILLGGNPEGLAAEYVERSLFTEEHLLRLAERFVESGYDAAVRLAESESMLDTSLADWLKETNDHYRAIVENMEAKGGWHAIAEDLRDAWDTPFDNMVTLVRYISEGNTVRAREMVQTGAVPAEALVDTRNRLNDYTQAVAAYNNPKMLGKFLADRLFEQHYNARAALTRATLAGAPQEGRAIADAIPALPSTLVDEVQNIQKEAEQNRQAIWDAGGLHIIGTERHESRRIDNQLRGRAARQGDPGSSRFYLSLEDELMRRFGGDRIRSIMDFARLPDDEPITANILSKAIGQAQSRFETYHFEIRKNLIEYDEAVNRQRGLVYKERREVLEGQGSDLDADIRRFFEEEFEHVIIRYIDDYLSWAETQVQTAVIDFANLETGEVNAPGVIQRVRTLLPDLRPNDVAEMAQMNDEQLTEALLDMIYEGQENGHNIRMMVGAILRIMPLWPALPDVTRSTGPEQQALLKTRLRETFDMYGHSLPPDEQERYWQAIEEGVNKAYHDLSLERSDKTNGRQEQAAIFVNMLNRTLLDVSYDLLGALDPDDLMEALIKQVGHLINLWRDDPNYGIGAEDMLEFERALMLSAIDTEWRQYLTAIDNLRQAVGLEAYGQRDPKIEFKRRVFDMFEELRDNVRETVTTRFFSELPRHKQIIEARRRDQSMRDNLGQTGYRAQRQKSGGITVRKEMWDVGRNEQCPCGSGKKFKNCHYHQVRGQLQTVSAQQVKQKSRSRNRRRRR